MISLSPISRKTWKRMLSFIIQNWSRRSVSWTTISWWNILREKSQAQTDWKQPWEKVHASVQLFRYAAVLHIETKVFRSFWTLSWSTCLLQQISRQSMVLTWMETRPWDILLMKSRSPLWHSRSWQTHSLENLHISVYIQEQWIPDHMYITLQRAKKSVLAVSFRCMLTSVWNWIRFTPVISLPLSDSNSPQLVIQSVMSSIR